LFFYIYQTINTRISTEFSFERSVDSTGKFYPIVWNIVGVIEV